ncbi:MAG TPA: RNA polymerase sigma factor [Fimbriimonas sp.]|nr:RNA polymerase sigma factor [Fimbriimonas sp.]
MGQKLSREEWNSLAESLFDEHGESVYRFAFRLSGNRSQAEDVTSETILAALQAISKVGVTGVTRPYLFGIALNKWRRSRSAPLAPISDLVETEAIDIEGMMDLEIAFRRLPKVLKESFVLVKAEGFTSKEAAEILKVPQGTVQSRVHEAVSQMRGTLSSDQIAHASLKEVKL